MTTENGKPPEPEGPPYKRNAQTARALALLSEWYRKNNQTKEYNKLMRSIKDWQVKYAVTRWQKILQGVKDR